MENSRVSEEHGMVITTVMFIRTRIFTSRKVVVNIRTVLLLIVKIVKNMKSLL